MWESKLVDTNQIYTQSACIYFEGVHFWLEFYSLLKMYLVYSKYHQQGNFQQSNVQELYGNAFSNIKMLLYQPDPQTPQILILLSTYRVSWANMPILQNNSFLSVVKRPVVNLLVWDSRWNLLRFWKVKGLL